MINCLRVLYPCIKDDKGVCFGIAHMAKQSFLAGEIEVFYRRLYNINYNFLPFIKESLQKVQGRGITIENDPEQFFPAVRAIMLEQFPYTLWFDINAFLMELFSIKILIIYGAEYTLSLTEGPTRNCLPSPFCVR